MEPADLLPTLLGTAVLLPLASFFAILLFGPRMGRAGRCAGYLATSAIGLGCLALVRLAVRRLATPEPADGRSRMRRPRR